MFIAGVDMKIVRKSSVLASNSRSPDDSDGLPMPAARRSPDRPTSDEPEACSFKSADFSHMSRHELHELINCQTRCGQLSLGGSATLAWLSTNVQSNQEHSTKPDEHESVDFLDLAQTSMEAALSEDKPGDAKHFEIALDIMYDIQGLTIGVDTLA